jgi:hypothetical protein
MSSPIKTSATGLSGNFSVGDPVQTFLSDPDPASGSDPFKTLSTVPIRERNFRFSANYEKIFRTFGHHFLKQQFLKLFSQSGEFL